MSDSEYELPANQSFNGLRATEPLTEQTSHRENDEEISSETDSSHLPLELFRMEGLQRIAERLGQRRLVSRGADRATLIAAIEDVNEVNRQWVREVMETLYTTAADADSSRETDWASSGSSKATMKLADAKDESPWVSKLKVNEPPNWKGGSLQQWKQWVEVFIDVAEECGYSDSVGERRLKRYTMESVTEGQFIKEYLKTHSWRDVIRKITSIKSRIKKGAKVMRLSDVTQGRDTVAGYLARFMRNAEEIQDAMESKFSDEELIRYFEQGLWARILRQIPITNLEIDRTRLIDFAESVIDVETEIKYSDEIIRRGKSERTPNSGGGSFVSSSFRCFFWRKYGTCKHGLRCHQAADHTTESKLAWKGKWVDNPGFKVPKSQKPTDGGNGKSGEYFSSISLINYGKTSENALMFMDSGTSYTETDKKEYFVAYERYPEKVKKTTRGVGNNVLRAEGFGIIALKCQETGRVILMRSDFVPGLGYTLISQGQMDRKGYKFVAENGVAHVTRSGVMVMKATRSDVYWNLYVPHVDVVAVPSEIAEKAMRKICETENFAHFSESVSMVSSVEMLRLAHERLAHVDIRNIVKMGKSDEFDGLEEFASITEKDLNNFSCETCSRVQPLRFVRSVQPQKRRVKRKPRKKSNDDLKSVKSVESRVVSISSDACGPLKESLWGNTYMKATVVSELGLIFGVGIPNKSSESMSIDTTRVLDMLRKRGWKVQKHISDNAKEFTGGAMRVLLEKEGIEQSVSVGYDSNANPRAERAIRTLMSSARCVMFQTRVPFVYWDFAVEFASYVRNSLFRRVDDVEIVGFSALNGVKAKLPEHLHVFGSVGWAKRHAAPEKGLQRTGNVRVMYVGPGELFVPKSRGAMFVDLDMLDSGEHICDCVFVSRKYKVFEGESCGLVMDENDDVVLVHQQENLSNFAVSFKDAMDSCEKGEWERAIQKENEALIKYGTYKVITVEELESIGDVLAGGKVFSTRYVLDQKTDKKKARLVVQAFDYCREGMMEVYSPVVREDTLFMVLNMFLCHSDWDLVQCDAVNAFLQSRLGEDIKVVVRSPDKKQLWFLQKALYGHPLAALAWYKEIDTVMTRSGWSRSIYDPCCYFKHSDSGELMCLLIVHVDDFLITGDPKVVANIKEVLFESFDMKEVELSCYLGIGMKIGKNCIVLDMKKYIQKLHDKFLCGNDNGNERMPYSVQDVKNVSFGTFSDERMRILTGSLIFVCKVRPELKYIVSFLCQFNNRFNDKVYQMGIRVVRYLWFTRDMVLRLEKNDLKLNGYFDASFGKELDLKSRSGILLRLGNSYLKSVSKKQSRVVDSSTYAEVLATVMGTRELEYMSSMMNELGSGGGIVSAKCKLPLNVFQDNQSAIKIFNKQMIENRSIHFDISHAYVKDLVTKGIIELSFVRSEDMIADGLTKPVCSNLFSKFRSSLGVGMYDLCTDQESALSCDQMTETVTRDV